MSLEELLREAVTTVRGWPTSSEKDFVVFCQSEDQNFILEPTGIPEDKIVAALSEAAEHFSVLRYVFFARMRGVHLNKDSTELPKETDFVVFFGEDREGGEVCELYNPDLTEKLSEGVAYTNVRIFNPTTKPKWLN